MIRAALDDYARTRTRQFDADRSQTVGASEVGQCARKVFYLKNEADPVCGAQRDLDFADGWGARLRGTVFEDQVWTPALRAKFNSQLLFAGDEQRTLVSGFVSATPDALLIEQPRDALAHLGVPDIGGDAIVLECKTADPRTKLDAAKPEHRYQVILQLGLLRESTEWKPNYAVISYTDSSYWHEGIEFAVAFDEKVFANAQDRARTIMTARSAAEIKPEGWIAGGRECAYCPFTRACGRSRTSVPPQSDEQPDPQFVAEIADLARAAKQHESEADAANSRLREAQHELRERMRAKGFRKVIGNGMSITWSPVRGRTSFNMPAIREAAADAGIDLAQYETTGDPTDRLVIQAHA